MNLNKLRIMQQIQIALAEKEITSTVMWNSSKFVNEPEITFYIEGVIMELILGVEATESELQLWHDTIVYGPQVSKED